MTTKVGLNMTTNLSLNMTTECTELKKLQYVSHQEVRPKMESAIKGPKTGFLNFSFKQNLSSAWGTNIKNDRKALKNANTPFWFFCKCFRKFIFLCDFLIIPYIRFSNYFNTLTTNLSLNMTTHVGLCMTTNVASMWLRMLPLGPIDQRGPLGGKH